MKRFIQGEDRTQVTMFPELLDDYVAESNPVRVVDVFVGELDLAQLGFEGFDPAATGRPAYHPATLLRIYIYGYLNRIQSSRRLEKEAQRNVELMWLTGRLTPDFKTIADFRKDNGKAICKVCRQFVVQCQRLNLFTDALVAIDGSKFKAVNNRDRNFTSPRTVASYRDAMMLFLDFAHKHLAKEPIAFKLADIEPDLILAFLDNLEQERHNSVRSRNLRLTALRAFMKFASRRDVSSFYVIERAMGVPMKRFESPMLGFLSREEMLAVIGLPGDTCTSQRDHLLLAMLYNTGARVSEIIGVKVCDVVLDESACVLEIKAWLRLNPTLRADAALLPNREGHAMTRFNVTQRLDIAVAKASEVHDSLSKRRISPHIIRHTVAMHLLQSGVAFSVIALWLGHESTTTTHRYVEADLTMKSKALARLQEPDTKMRLYRLS